MMRCRHLRRGSSKHQTTNHKQAPNVKHQLSNPRFASRGLRLGFGDLVIGACLSFVIWSLRFRPSPAGGRIAVGVLLVGLAVLPGEASARGSAYGRRLAATVVVPQARAFPRRAQRGIEVTGVTAQVAIVDKAATTTLDIALRNHSRSRLEAQLVVPVPDGAVVRGFAFEGNAQGATAKLLAKDEARQTYDAIVARMRDPAILEFIGCNLVRSSVFPVEPKGTQKVRLVYEHILPSDGRRIDYVLPRSESVDYDVPWRITVAIRSNSPVSTVYSPSHRVLTTRHTRRDVTARIVSEAAREPGPFRLSYLVQRDGLAASLFAYPSPDRSGGYFLLVVGLPAKAPGRTMQREVTLVLDRSGSMSGKKLRQVRAAATQVLRSLDPGEAFNIITYNQGVDFFADRPVPKTPKTQVAALLFLQGVRPRGGTNIHDALKAALRQRPRDGSLPIVLFLTDGLPTIGTTSEKGIRKLVQTANPHKRRVFTFGVGVDVNTPLLERIARETRGTATFVLPDEDVRERVWEVFGRLAGPVLAEPRLRVLDPDGRPAPERVHDVVPAQLNDLFAADQLVVLGQYAGDAPLALELSGNYLGNTRAFKFAFEPSSANPNNGFVARLWASRQIAVLLDAIRDLGADRGIDPKARKPDPRMEELIGEVVRLSTEFGVLTEYTAFLALEGTDLRDATSVLAQARANFATRAVRSRSGLASVNQEINRQELRNQLVLNTRNTFFDERMNAVATRGVQQVSDRAFYRRGRGWVDSRILDSQRYAGPSRTVEFGSREYMDVAFHLAKEGRQGLFALRGDILVVVAGEPLLLRGPNGK